MITIGFEAHRKDQGFLFHNNLKQYHCGNSSSALYLLESKKEKRIEEAVKTDSFVSVMLSL